MISLSLENNLPDYDSFMKNLFRFDKLFNGTLERSLQFPVMCFESSLLVYLYLKYLGVTSEVSILCGEIQVKPGKYTLHHWIKVEDEIVDYTRIQFAENVKNGMNYEEVLELAHRNNIKYIFSAKASEYKQSSILDLTYKHQEILDYIYTKKPVNFEDMCDVLFEYLYSDFRSIREDSQYIEWIMQLMPTLQSGYKFWWEYQRNKFWDRYISESSLTIDYILNPFAIYRELFNTNKQKFYYEVNKYKKYSEYIYKEMREGGYIPPTN